MKKVLDFKKIFLSYKDLNNDEKGLLFTRSIRAFESLVKGIFVNIYIFTIEQNISQVLWINIIGYLSTTIWYWGFSLVQTRYTLNVKRVLQSSFIISIISFLLLIFAGNNIEGVIVFTIINGISRWLYFSSLIYFESYHIKDKKSDFYGSMVYFLKKSIWIISPLIITWLFFIPEYFNISGYSLVFATTILVNCITIWYVNRLSNHKIDIIPLKELNIRKFTINEILHYMTFGMYNCGKIIISLVLLYVLKSEINIWFYETILAIFSIFLVLKNSIQTNRWNRKKHYTIIWLILAINVMLFGFNLTIIWLTIYTIIDLLIEPIFGSMRFWYYFDFLESKKASNKFMRVVNADFWTQTGRILFLWIILLGIYLAPTGIVLNISMIAFSLCIIAAVLVIRKVW